MKITSVKTHPVTVPQVVPRYSAHEQSTSFDVVITEVQTDNETGAILYGTTDVLLTQLGINSLEELPPIAPLLPDGQESF